MILGQAAGAAAALAKQTGKPVHDVDVKSLQRLLQSQKAILEYPVSSASTK
jgi:hypothetical protein